MSLLEPLDVLILTILFVVGFCATCVTIIFGLRRRQRCIQGLVNQSRAPPQSGSLNDCSLRQHQRSAYPPTRYKGPVLPKHTPPPPFPGANPGVLWSTFTYEQLKHATNNFADVNLLGQGGFGYVHKGVLPDGQVVAIKQLKAGGGQGEREFRTEVGTIGRVHHRNLVSLVGYCISGAHRLLVYEFVPNKNLEFHLRGKGRLGLDWSTRMRIALGSATGLAYLHEHCQPRIIHRDIKSANILIDNSFEAKVADFGLAKYYSDTDTHVTTRVMGTFGYLAPEYAASGQLTEKSDIFSFGIVLLELITGHQPCNKNHSYVGDSLVNWARPLLTKALDDGNLEGLVDRNLQEYDSGQMYRMVACAACSIRHLAGHRPRMSQIVRALEGNMSLDELNDGIAPGHSTDYGSSQYKEDMNQFMKMVLGNTEQGSSYCSGQQANPVGSRLTSSTEGQQTTQFDFEIVGKTSPSM